MTTQPIIVSKDIIGSFHSIQEAILSIDDQHEDTITILIKPGVYTEKIWIRKENIRIIGEDANTTIVRYGDGAKKPRPDGSEYGTFNSATIFFAGSDITVENITIENTAGVGHIAGQALAAYVASDKTTFRNCRFIGYQDTIFTGDSQSCSMKKLMLPDFFLNSSVNIDYPVIRNYFDSCYISGDVDFIFGPNIAYFNRCEIFSRKLESESNSFITAASTPAAQEYGYVFNQCHLTSNDRPDSVYLGRPWRDYAKTAFIQCCMEEHIKPIGWHNWGKANAEATTSYVEYGNTGAGANPEQRTPFSKQLTNPEILEYYSIERVLAGMDNWRP